jgi:tetratricopeptide (TPR) repeat protein
VEIRLPADRAYFETNAFWYNPTPLEQPYYNWMTAAAFARDDLEMSIPGNAYLQHSGTERTWPVDDRGRNLARYSNNTFGGHKSYHVVGELNDFFGGYYHDASYGFGHWARYEDMPGQKLWLWALSREGGVWEDLLTDTDGQYIEFQAGRLFVQYAPGDEVNPITQAGFDPLSASRWTETWFPLEGTGGLTDASRDGAMHVAIDDGTLRVGVNAFRETADTLSVWSGGQRVARVPLSLAVLEPYRATFDLDPAAPVRVELPALGLAYDSNPSGRALTRPFSTDPDAVPSIPELDRRVFQARELVEGRRHREARALFESALDEEPWNRAALLGLGDLSARAGLFQEGLTLANRALQLDAYDAEANFLAGVLYRALGRSADAHDAFGWAARSTGYRSAAYVELAESMMRRQAHREAVRYARLALDYDRLSVPAWRVLAITGRRSGDSALAQEANRQLLSLDPLHHLVRSEAYLAEPGPEPARLFRTSLGGEYPDQTLLELAADYTRLGLRHEARTILEVGTASAEVGPPPGSHVISAWRAWLADDPRLLDVTGEPSFQFPFRTETIAVLEWASRQRDDWVWEYLLALNLWAVGRPDEAATHMMTLGSKPSLGAFYVARSHLLHEIRDIDPTADLRRAVAIDPATRSLHVSLARHLLDTARWNDALTALDSARSRFPDDFDLELLRVRALLRVGRAEEATRILGRIRVLPSENARESHRLYEQAHTLVALDALESGNPTEARDHLSAALQWPESLGQGRPYEPEERLVRFLLARSEELLGNEATARQGFRAVVDASDIVALAQATDGEAPFPPGEVPRGGGWTRLDVLAIPALRALGRASDSGVDWAPADPVDLAALLETRFPDHFDDLEGRMILRAISLAR